jgi:hypothetical protein
MNAAAVAQQPKAVSDGSNLVNEWLKRKAEEQRKAARDFLNKPATVADVPKEQHSIVQATDKDGAACAATGTAQEPAMAQIAGGVIRRKVYSGSVQAAASASPLAATEIGGSTIVQSVAGGVIRGKVYKKLAWPCTITYSSCVFADLARQFTVLCKFSLRCWGTMSLLSIAVLSAFHELTLIFSCKRYAFVVAKYLRMLCEIEQEQWLDPEGNTHNIPM